MKIRIGGVPEHFNFPWHFATKNDYFKIQDIELLWNDFPSGTGAMCEALKSGELDLALVLTEGIVSEASKNSNLKIVSEYVSSPLLWGIHVPFQSSIEITENIKGKTYAISRFGSGSHLMAFVDCLKRGWPSDSLNFQIVNNIDGARAAFKNGEAEVFFWEKFMTKPLVDQKEFKRVGVRPTPWPCFLLAGRTDFLENNKQIVLNIVQTISNTIQKLTKDPENTIKEISSYYKLSEQDIQEWYSVTKWSPNGSVSEVMLNEVSAILHKLKLIEQPRSAKEICCSFANLVS